MDILDFFGTFYLNHLSPLWGYFSYIVVFLGMMQIGLFDGLKNYQHMHKFMEAMVEVNPNAHVTFSSLVPRLTDHP